MTTIHQRRLPRPCIMPAPLCGRSCIEEVYQLRASAVFAWTLTISLVIHLSPCLSSIPSEVSDGQLYTLAASITGCLDTVPPWAQALQDPWRWPWDQDLDLSFKPFLIHCKEWASLICCVAILMAVAAICRKWACERLSLARLDQVRYIDSSAQ